MHLAPVPTHRTAHRRTCWFGWAVLAAVAIAAIALMRLFWVAAEVRTVRDGFFAAGGDWRTQLQFNAGPLLLGTARCAARFAPMEPEVRAALAAIRRVSVGIYHERQPRETAGAARREAFAATRREAGWERIGAVRDGDREVDVYVQTPAPDGPARDLRVCIAVRDGGRLVVASLRADPEPLVALAAQRSPERAMR